MGIGPLAGLQHDDSCESRFAIKPNPPRPSAAMARSLHTAAHRELVSAVKALRKSAGLSQRELAERLGREQNFVGRIETGQRRIDLVEWVMLCRACGVEPASELTRIVTSLAALLAPRPPKRQPPTRKRNSSFSQLSLLGE